MFSKTNWAEVVDYFVNIVEPFLTPTSVTRTICNANSYFYTLGVCIKKFRALAWVVYYNILKILKLIIKVF